MLPRPAQIAAAAREQKGIRVFLFDFLASIIVTLVAVVVIVYSGRMPPSLTGDMGPGHWPGFLGYVLLILGLILLIETYWKRRIVKRRQSSAERCVAPPAPIQFASPGMYSVYILFALFVVFSILLAKVNFLVATFVFAPCCMRLLGEKRPPVLAALAVGVPVAVYVIFVRILGISLP